MKWIGIKTHTYKLQTRRCWHFWFAWIPVVVHRYPDGAVKIVWLENVLRKGEYVGGCIDNWWSYKYKEIEK